MGDCYDNYRLDETDYRGGYTTKAGYYFGYMNNSFLEDDGPWQSPITLTTYDSGGYVADLDLGVGGGTADLDNLKSMGFIDAGTRALFMDFGLYCVNNDQFLSGRIVYEFSPTGAIMPFMELIPAALITDIRALTQDESTPVDLAQVIFEFLLYIVIIAYLARASDKIAKYPSLGAYFANPWNSVDFLNVGCFIAVFAIRLYWMILSYKFTYIVDPGGDCTDAAACYSENEIDDNKYTPFREAVIWYSFGKTFFAFGTLLSFVKTFQYIGVSQKVRSGKVRKTRVGVRSEATKRCEQQSDSRSNSLTPF